MDNTRKLWIDLATLLAVSFALLLFIRPRRHAPVPVGAETTDR